jgi:hypothetical protein
LTVGRLFEVTLDALETRIGEDLIASEPGCFVWNGRQGKAPKQWVFPFGQVRHHYRRMLDRRSGSVFCPLREALAIPKYKRLTWPVLAGPLGLVPELSYRRAAAEGRRLQRGAGPGRSSTWMHFQAFAQSELDPLLAPAERELEVVIADGTKLKQQQAGYDGGKMELRIALSTDRDGKGLQVAAFGLDEAWPTLKERLRRDFPGLEVEVLITDGEAAVEALADLDTRIQRCLVHGPRGFSFALYQDGYRKPDQRRFLKHFRNVDAWRTDAEALQKISHSDREVLADMVTQAETVSARILELLPQKASHARSYIQNYVQPSLSYVRALLDGEPPLPAVTTNRAENAIGQMTTRLKGIGKRWGLEGGLNIVRALLTKIFNNRLWRERIEVFASSLGGVTLESRFLDMTWAS